jgi:hypothetical protein
MFVMGEIALKLTSAVMLLMTVTKRTGKRHSFEALAIL